MPGGRLYCDEDVDVRLTEALIRRGHDVHSAPGAGLLGASDDAQLSYAASDRRIFVTHNVRHFPAIHQEWIQAGRHHLGIVILIGHSAPGLWLQRIERVLALYAPAALSDTLLFLGSAYDQPR